MPVPTRGSRPRKWRTLGVYWCAQAAALFLFWPLILCNDLGELANLPRMWFEGEFAGWTLFAIGLLTAGQLAFVLPIAPPRIGASSRIERSARHAVAGIAAGTMAALTVSAALVGGDMLWVYRGPDFGWAVIWGTFTAVSLGVTGLLLWRYRQGTPIGISIAIAGVASIALLLAIALALVELVETIQGADADERVWAWVLIGSLLAGWLVATPLLAAFVRRGPRETRLERLAARLFLGSMVEAVAIIPLDVMVRRRTSCYCGEGTFWSLVFCGSVGVLMLGPGMYFLLGRRRQRWLAGRCEACDYDMSGCPDALRCPECGAGWKTTPAAP